jgi:hypothetical protein
MEKHYHNCQSCGMPLKRDPKGGGTNADGSPSAMYCSFCYELGAFLNPEIGLQEMQELVRGRLREMGFPRILAGFFVRRIPKLERWKRHE